ncbi:MAG TPA: hypothetical protein VK436_10630 [Methanocella sp.]|nr:hypothetical protein [Methanocella sp.]
MMRVSVFRKLRVLAVKGQGIDPNLKENRLPSMGWREFFYEA